MYEIQVQLKNNFINKFVYTKSFVVDITSNDDKAIIIEETHCPAHRGVDENYKQITRLYYWPNLYKKLKEYITNCEIFNTNKYNRNPTQIPIGEAPIPKIEGQHLHIDIIYAQNLTFLTCIDSYSKDLVVKEITNKKNIDLKVYEILQTFPQVKTIMTHNEPSFTSAQFTSFLQRSGISIHYAYPRHSLSNGQVERAHSTLTEIARCVKDEYCLLEYPEVIIRAAKSYNMTIHSVINQKPYDILFNKIDHSDLP